MNKKAVAIIAAFILGMVFSYNLGASKWRNPKKTAIAHPEGKMTAEAGFKPNQGYVPDEETAVKIAEAVWLNIYGEDIYNRLPFVAYYDGKTDNWLVYGSMPEAKPGVTFFGGVPEMTIRKADGQILWVSHGE